MILYAAEHEGRIFGIGDTEARAAQDANRIGHIDPKKFRYHAITIDQAKKIASGVVRMADL
jgi:hypothetical protein